jgi:Flp pilus assembly pilin Flp
MLDEGNTASRQNIRASGAVRLALSTNLPGRTTMLPSRRQLWHLAGDDDGLSAVEYACLLALIVIVAISAVQSLGNAVYKSFFESNAHIQDAIR